MSENCSFIEGCPIFRYFRVSAKTVYMDMYCMGNFERCKRRKLRLAGQPVPDNLLPHGGTLWDPMYQPAAKR
jgi:hypothetical protein